MQTSTTPNIGWIEDSNNQPASIDVFYHRQATCENFIDAFPDAPKDTFKTNRRTLWFVAKIDERIVGVCAAEIQAKESWTYRSAYILPLFRSQGIYEELCEYREEYVKDYHVGSEIVQYPDTRFKDGDPDGERQDNLLIGFWPTPETSEHNWQVHEQHYRAVACTYNVEMQIVEKPSQIIVDDHRPWISIEEYREGKPGVRYDQFVYPEKAIYLVGNSDWRHMSDIVEVDHIINVPTPGGYEHPLYGNQVATIVFQQRSQQFPVPLPGGGCGT